MKIISEIPSKSYSSEYLVKISKGELEDILGLEYDKLKYEDIKDAIKNESILEVGKIYSQYYNFKNHLNKSSYDTARKKLEDMLSALTPIEDLIKTTPLNELLEK